MMDALSEQISSYRAGIDSIDDKIKSLENRLSQIESNLDQWNIPEMQKQIHALQDNLNKLMAELRGTPAEQKVAEVANKVGSLASMVSSPNVTPDQIRGIVLELRDEIRGWKNRVLSMREDLNELESEFSELSQKVSSVDSLNADVSDIAAALNVLVDKLLEINSRLSALEATEKQLISFDEKVASSFSNTPKLVEPKPSSDAALGKVKTILGRVGKHTQPASGTGVQKGQQTTPRRASSPGMSKKPIRKTNIPIVEEITIGGPTMQDKTSSSSGEAAPKLRPNESTFSSQITDILNKLKVTDPKKWGLYKSDLLKLLSKALDETRKEVARRKPPNEKSLNLLLSKAELGVISLEAVFDLGDYNRVDAIVRNTLSTISDVRSQLS